MCVRRRSIFVVRVLGAWLLLVARFRLIARLGLYHSTLGLLRLPCPDARSLPHARTKTKKQTSACHLRTRRQDAHPKKKPLQHPPNNGKRLRRRGHRLQYLPQFLPHYPRCLHRSGRDGCHRLATSRPDVRCVCARARVRSCVCACPCRRLRVVYGVRCIIQCVMNLSIFLHSQSCIHI